ncbi:MAG: hypothetical protein AAF267_23330 [Deinococcota bacterium]
MTNVVYRRCGSQYHVRSVLRARTHALQRGWLVLLLAGLSCCVVLATAQNPAEWCRSGHFVLPSEAAGFNLARVTTARSYFYGDETTAGQAGCPTAGGTACQLSSYVIKDDIVVLNSKTYGEFSCVRYTASAEQSTTGWLKTVSLEPTRVASTQVPPTPDAWQGTWLTYDNTLVISQSALDRGFIVEGEAYWYGLNTIHTGEVVSRADPFENQLILFDAYDCQLTLTLLQDYLIAQDNKRCGGMNVTFDGIYTRP